MLETPNAFDILQEWFAEHPLFQYKNLRAGNSKDLTYEEILRVAKLLVDNPELPNSFKSPTLKMVLKLWARFNEVGTADKSAGEQYLLRLHQDFQFR